MDARALIQKADGIARKKHNLSQAKWSAAAGCAVSGQTVSHMMACGDCKLSTLVTLLGAIGCELEIVEKDNI